MNLEFWDSKSPTSQQISGCQHPFKTFFFIPLCLLICQPSVTMKEAPTGDCSNRRVLRSETSSDSIAEPSEVVFLGSDFRTDEELFMKAKREILKAKDSKDIVFTGVEPVRGCRIADSLIEHGDIEGIAARYD